jgi:SAM-dependent methyltransferase
MLAVTEHMEPVRLVAVFREARRLLKPNGRFILTTPCPWTDRLLRFMVALRLVSREEIKDHKVTYHLDSLAQHLEQAGFEKQKMKTGYFEMRVNSWAYVDK